jgi:hypothetical protein
LGEDMNKNKLIGFGIVGLIFLFFIVLLISNIIPMPPFMEKVLGVSILLITIVSLAFIYSHIAKNKIYAKDLFGLIVDSWEVAGLAIALILVSLFLILKH